MRKSKRTGKTELLKSLNGSQKYFGSIYRKRSQMEKLNEEKNCRQISKHFRTHTHIFSANWLWNVFDIDTFHPNGIEYNRILRLSLLFIMGLGGMPMLKSCFRSHGVEQKNVVVTAHRTGSSDARTHIQTHIHVGCLQKIIIRIISFHLCFILFIAFVYVLSSMP